MDDRQAGETPLYPDERPRAMPAETPTRVPRRSRTWLKLLSIVVLVPALLFAAWIAITLNWVYSRGERAGYIQKFSQKGWVCKTWEGELAMVNMPGTTPELFPFTVKSDSLAQVITKLMGSRVALSYEQHKGVPGSCFGETEYFVVHAQPVASP